MRTDPLLTSLTEWIVLGLIRQQSRHGFAIANELKRDAPLGHAWTVSRPLVYRAIEHLAALDLVVAARTEPGQQGPQRTLFRVTEKGRSWFDLWVDQTVKHPRDVRSELIVKFILRLREGMPLAPLARRQLEEFEPVAGGLLSSARTAQGERRVAALWRVESMHAITRMLRKVIIAEE